MDQLSPRLQTAMQAVQGTTARLDEDAKAATRASTAVSGMAAEHENAARSVQAVTHGASDLQNVLSNLAVNASMGGGAFSNLAWGLMFAPTSAAVAMTGAATVAYGLVEAMVAAEQEAQHLADRSRDLATANHVSMEESAAWAPVLDALGIKTNDLAKAQQEAIDKTGSLATVQELLGEAATSGAVATDQQTAALLAQEDATARLSLAWQGLQLQLGSQLAPALESAAEGWTAFVEGARDAHTASTLAGDAGALVGRVLHDLEPPIDVVTDLFNKQARASEEAAIAARNHTQQLAALEKQEQAALTATEGAAQAAQRQRQAQLQLTQSIDTLSSASETATLDQRKVQESTDKVKVAQDAYTEAVKRYGPASDQALKAHTALMTAQDGLTKAQDAGKQSALQQQQAELQAQSALLEIASSAAGAAEKQAELSGKHLTAAETARAEVDALRTVEATIAPGSPLRAYIDQYIAQLDAIPRSVTTTIRTINFHESGSLDSNVPTSAEGGIFTRPTLTWVGEAGPEIVAPLRPGNTMPGAYSLPAGLGGGESMAQTEYLLSQMLRVLQAMYDSGGSGAGGGIGSLLTGA